MILKKKLHLHLTQLSNNLHVLKYDQKFHYLPGDQ